MSDVIVAISTARGEGAVGIVRLSGSGADKVASQLFYRKNFDFSTAEANKLYLGTVTAGRISDKALAVIFKAPKSYTGEDVIEFHLHGGRVITEAVLEAAVNLGARPAEPGEFTKRAYLNGKISLSAAEGVEAIISADSAAEAVAAYRALGGELDRTIKRAEEQEQKEERLSNIEEEKSEVFLPPSAVAAASEAETASAARTVDMTGRGIESLTRMEDRELVEKASKTKQGAKFSALFNGLDVLGSEEKNERSLMARLAVHTSDKDKLMRVFKASGQYRDDKPNAYYERMATEEMQFVSGLREKPMAPAASATAKAGRFANVKS